MPQQQLQRGLDARLPIAQVERDVQRIGRQRGDAVRHVVAQIHEVAGPHDDLRFDRTHLRGFEIGKVHPPRRLPSMQAPALLARHVDDEHVVGVDMAAIGFVALLRKERRRVAESRCLAAVECRRERIDLRLEDVEPFEHARGAILEMCLQHALVDERDLAFLHELVQACRRKVDRLAGLEEVQVIEIEQRVVQMPPKVGEREQLLFGHESRAMDMGDVGSSPKPVLEIEIANSSLNG